VSRWETSKTSDPTYSVGEFLTDDFDLVVHSSQGSSYASSWLYKYISIRDWIGIISNWKMYLSTGSLMEAYRCISCRIRSVWDPKLPPKSRLSAFLRAISASRTPESEFIFISSSNFDFICCNKNKVLGLRPHCLKLNVKLAFNLQCSRWASSY
jgi:hypothetical protein